MVAECMQQWAELRFIQRNLGECQRQAQRGKCISTAPCSIRDRSMSIKAVRSKVEFLYKCEMPHGEIKILAVSCELSSFGQKGNRHKDGIAHFVMEGHGFFHLTVFCKSKISRGANELQITRIAGPFGQFGEDKISGQCG